MHQLHIYGCVVCGRGTYPHPPASHTCAYSQSATSPRSPPSPRTSSPIKRTRSGFAERCTPAQCTLACVSGDRNETGAPSAGESAVRPLVYPAAGWILLLQVNRRAYGAVEFQPHAPQHARGTGCCRRWWLLHCGRDAARQDVPGVSLAHRGLGFRVCAPKV